MIDIAPKALRFARLAAEQQSLFADDPQIAMLRKAEEAIRREPSAGGRYIGIQETTAQFCIRVMSAFLEEPGRFQSSEWDGNDFVFLQSVTKSLRDQLMRPVTQSL